MKAPFRTTAWPSWYFAVRQGAGVRTLFEAGLGCALLLVFARLLQFPGSGAGTAVADVLLLLSSAWLVIWPAWRLRPTAGHGWWTRTGLSLLRAVVIGLLLTGLATALSAVIVGYRPTWNGMAGILVWYLLLRVVVAAGVVVAGRVRRRVRWQLIVSHVGIIVLMFVTLTSGGSVLGLIAVTHFIPPHPMDMATSIRDELALARAVTPLNRQRIDEVFRLIYARRLPVRGGSPLIAFAGSPQLPDALGLVDTTGAVVQGRITIGQDGRKTRSASSWTDLVHLAPVRAAKLLSIASRGRAGREQIWGSGQNGPETVVVLPVRNANGMVTSLLALRVTDFQPTRQQFLHILLAVFGVTTIALIVVTSVPMLGLSFLFSYLLARGLTRRLEALSSVATSIAAGNLTERAPVTAGNEVGRLAEDVNRMADHLQTTMGELEAARTESDEALRLRQELVANISHELRTPLATMRAQLETVMLHDSLPVGVTPNRGGGDASVPFPTLQALQAETGRLEALVEDLFALSRAQAGAMELQLETIDVAELVDEVAAFMRPLAQLEGKIALSAEVLRRPLWARADRTRLQQILANLVRNAVRYTPDGGIIVMSVSRQSQWIQVSVADTGEGIAADQVPHIFDRFYRADPARSRDTGGAGLGLAIVREFVELMGGRVEVESVVGEGTRFHVFVPSA